MKPKLLKVLGDPIAATIKSWHSFEKLSQVVGLFNKNSTLKTCKHGLNYGCI
jgi:hypothetical protein